ncbi:uncharacterized protein LOC131841251 [Achroia grisella]|uniref:uncharacterized protein LOC131841251 n=1 Tax=Achroia grisella TaxID=688607 RepID=UPI0027D2873B|nr:uncharacterized protein LOC131841251 [Achroia grisella]
MADVSKEELEKEIAKILKNADLAKTSTNKVIQKLEEVFEVELAEKKKMIDQMVIEYVNAQGSDDENDEEDDDDEEEEEEKPKKTTKRAAPVSKRSTKKRKDSSEDEEDNSDSEYEKEKPKKKKGKKKDSDDDFDGGRGKKDKKKAPKTKKAGGRGKGGGYTRAYKLSPALSALMGADEMPRHEVVKRVWAIIKEKKLYDPNNRQFAICDDALYKVIGTKRFRTFGMMKYLKSHFIDE